MVIRDTFLFGWPLGVEPCCRFEPVGPPTAAGNDVPELRRDSGEETGSFRAVSADVIHEMHIVS